MQQRALTAAVFLASLVVLGWKAGSSGVASAYVDPVAKVQAQDEALYGSISLRMAAHGDFMTPVFLGRYELVKPPLLYWLEAAGMKLGLRPVLAMRLPSLFAGAATVALVFAWVSFTWANAEGAGVAAGFAAALLLLASHLFFVISRVGLTDALLTLTTALAMFALARDPRLAARSSLWTFGLASGAAIMSKGIAGLFPLLALGLFCVISKERPGLARLAQAVAISAAIAAPWHLYELWQHTRWFLAQYVMGEIVTNSLSSPTQSTQETHVLYYAKRLVLLDPALLGAALLIGALAALTRRRPRVLLCWIAVVLAAALSFDYRNTSYLLPIYPALAVLAGLAIPRSRGTFALGIAVLLFAGKTLAPAEPWGLPFGQEAPMPSEAVLDRYAALHRGNALMIGEPEDEFYSACLSLPKVSYVYISPNHLPAKPPSSYYALDFEYLGVTVTAQDFARLAELRPQFEQRLREWGLNHSDSIASVILASSPEQAEELLKDHPEADFFVPAAWASHDNGAHDVLEASNGRELLLAHEVIHAK